MRRSPLWLPLVVLLAGALLVREPRLRAADDFLLGCFLQQSEFHFPPAAVTQLEVDPGEIEKLAAPARTKATPRGMAGRRSLSPLEYALFLQAAMVFQPAVIGLEPIAIWRDRDKDQEQVFLDQAMRVPKLLVAIELGEKGPRDFPSDDVRAFTKVSGSPDRLAEFPGVAHRPDDDIRLIATPGFINLPNDRSDRIRLPMVFRYRGEIVPSFPLQAVLLWLRATPADVKVELGGRILLPNGWEIPIDAEGTTTINPRAAASVRHLSLGDLVLAAQERENRRAATIDLDSLRNQIMLLRLADDPLQAPNIFATAVAAIQNNAYVRRVSPLYDWALVAAAAVFALFLWRFSKFGLLLTGLAVSAGYGLVVLSFLNNAERWLPSFNFFVLLWSLILIRFTVRVRRMKDVA